MSPSRFPYCSEQVKRSDEDRYLAALFAPAQTRDGLMALYAFNIEVARAREAVSEALLGEIRLTWWRDSIEGLYEGTPRQGHDVLEALGETIQRWDLPRDLFDALVTARGCDLEDQPHKSFADLLAYGKATSEGVMTLAGMIAAPEMERGHIEQIMEPAGRAYGLTGLLRAMPYLAQQRRLFLPDDLIERCGVDVEGVFAGRMHSGLGKALGEISDNANQALKEVRSQIKDTPQSLMPVLLPCALSSAYLKQMKGEQFDPFKNSVSLSLLRRQMSLLWASLRHSI